MSALTADTNLDHRGPIVIRHYKSAVADTFYKGAAVYYSTTVDGITPVAAAGTEFAGFVAESPDGAVSIGDRVKVYIKGTFKVPYASATPSGVNGQALCSDVTDASDNPSDFLVDSAAATGDLIVGIVEEWHDSSYVWLNIDSRVKPSRDSVA